MQPYVAGLQPYVAGLQPYVTAAAHLPRHVGGECEGLAVHLGVATG